MAAVVALPGLCSDAEVLDLMLERLTLRMERALMTSTPARAGGGLAAVERALGERRVGRDRRLATSLGLGDDELDFMWLAVAMGSDPLLGQQAVSLGGTDAKRGATLAVFAKVMEVAPARTRALARALGADHPLIRNGLLEPAEEHVSAMTPLRAARRLIRHLAGDDTLDEALAPGGRRVQVPAQALWDAEAEAARERITRVLVTGEPVLLRVEGAPGAGRRTLIAWAAQAAGRQVVALDLARVAPTAEAWGNAILALRRECVLSGALPLLAGVDASPAGDAEPLQRLALRAIDETAGPIAVVCDEGAAPLAVARAVLLVSLPVPCPALRRNLWRAALAGTVADEEVLESLAAKYRLGAGPIASATRAARLAASARGALTPSTADLSHGVSVAIGQRMGELARRVEVQHDWSDLILPDDAREQLDGLVLRVRHAFQVLDRWGFRRKVARGGGLTALLSGPPGTGKTMVAGLLARALGLDLYQVDLGAVVSKWIGETEKNLNRLFEAADSGHALLLFDEADSLFSKRTEVRGANDRHANLEVNHLLSRIEAFGGIAVLTTNFDSSLDPALRRRLAMHVVFDKPSQDERRRLWERLLDGPAPRSAIDTAALAARFPDMTGGNIRNAVVAAAFRAAAERGEIGHDHVWRAAIDEYRAMGRIYMEQRS